MEELHKTWDDIASNWYRWSSPLRPSPEDINIFRTQLTNWKLAHQNFPSTVSMFMLGITPEIATMDYPFLYNLLGMDIAENMVKEVWPGNIPHIREAIVGDWFDLNVNSSFDVVMADGSFVFFNREQTAELTRLVSGSIKEDGVFLLRQFVAPTHKETLEEINEELRCKRLRNFHELKFRVAMSLQKSSDKGVTRHSIYEAVNGLNWAIGNPAFSNSDWITLEFYKGKTSTMHFPTIREYGNIFIKHFDSISIEYPNYTFGYCCPTIVLSRPIK